MGDNGSLFKDIILGFSLLLYSFFCNTKMDGSNIEMHSVKCAAIFYFQTPADISLLNMIHNIRLTIFEIF